MAALIGISLKPKDGDESASATVPLDLLGQDGVPPEEGDEVSFSVKGTVKSIDPDGETASVDIESIDGQPVSESSAQEAGEGEPGEGPGGPPAGGPPGKGGSAALRPALAKRAAANKLGLF
jgi:hypothetical protein